MYDLKLIMQHFTLMELLRVSHDKSRRAGIFIADADKSGKQLVYVLELWQALLLNFGRSYQTLSTRGGSRPLTTARPAPPSAPDPRAIKVQQADVFRPINKPKSAIEAALQSTLDGPVRPTPPAVVNAEKVVLNVESKALKQVEGVAQQALKRIEGVPVGEAVLAETKGLVQGVYQWYGRDWAKRSVGTSVPDPSVTNWTMESEFLVLLMLTLSLHCSKRRVSRGGQVWVCPVRLARHARGYRAVPVRPAKPRKRALDRMSDARSGRRGRRGGG